MWKKRAHPRVCGENTKELMTSVQKEGSSPRVRGKPGLVLDVLAEPGLIPACAGKTLNDLEF